MLSIKTDFNVGYDCFNQFARYFKDVHPYPDLLPSTYYQTNKVVSKLGLEAIKIDCCTNGCMLYYGNDVNYRECKFCNHPRYRPRKLNSKSKEVPFKRMHYLPLIPRLKRLYASTSTTEYMTWHHRYRRSPGVIQHPSDGKAWKHFNRVHPDFASESRNVRLALCADGFTP
jgi:hypothetical protein